METPTAVFSRNLFGECHEAPRKRCRLVAGSVNFEERVDSLFAPDLKGLVNLDAPKGISPAGRSSAFKNAVLKMRNGNALRRLEEERDAEARRREMAVSGMRTIAGKSASETLPGSTLNVSRHAPERARSGTARTA